MTTKKIEQKKFAFSAAFGFVEFDLLVKKRVTFGN
jgi:hypothetical protein